MKTHFKYCLLLSLLLCEAVLYSQTGQSQGNYLTVNKCQIQNSGVKTDFYTLYYCMTGKQPQKIGDYRTDNGNSFTIDGSARFIAQGCVDPEKICIEEYIIDGNETGNSTPSINNTSTPIIGKQVIITSQFRSISWNFALGTEVDPGDGSVSSVTVNGFTYYPTDEGFNPDGYTMTANKDQYIDSNYSIIADGNAVVKISVAKINCE